MFTGIVTDIGRIRSIERETGGEWGDTRMTVYSNYDYAGVKIGGSISHAGACMTVTETGQDEGGRWHAFDVSDESLSKTTMGDWAVGERVNLERALTGADELGGHLVTGHIDGTGQVKTVESIAGSTQITLTGPDDLKFAIAKKGSITVDGVSLTVNDVDGGEFALNIIPHTAEVTTLGELQPGDKVNLEIDLIARYVARYLENMKA